MIQDFRKTKIKILSEEHSKAFQDAVFEVGGKWCDSGEFYLRSVDFIFVNDYLSMSLCDNAEFFQDHNYKEIQFPLTKHIHTEPTPNVTKLVEALRLAKEMFIANDLILPRTFEVIDEALATHQQGGDL